MQVVQDSAEHHFLTLLETIRSDPAGWVGIHCSFSRQVDHMAMMDHLGALSGQIAQMQESSKQFVIDLAGRADNFGDGAAYHFADHDILLVARPLGDAAQNEFYALFKDISAQTKTGLVDFINFSRDMMGAQKIADRKLLGTRRMAAYDALSDSHQISSIPIRRQRRDHAVILIVEDDRFTATYTTGILSKHYDLVHARTGEDAILDYINHAPDVVFLDIHLPGLNGLETLAALRAADPEAHVVILSVDTARSNVVQATHQGAAGFLKKPFSKDRILSIVEKSPFVRGSKSIVNRA